jgi:fructokinase
VIDTTGGGDSTMAAILHQLHTRGEPDNHTGWVHLVTQALVVAAIVCSRRGGAIAMPTGDEARAAGAEL